MSPAAVGAVQSISLIVPPSPVSLILLTGWVEINLVNVSTEDSLLSDPLLVIETLGCLSYPSYNWLGIRMETVYKIPQYTIYSNVEEPA